MITITERSANTQPNHHITGNRRDPRRRIVQTASKHSSEAELRRAWQDSSPVSKSGRYDNVHATDTRPDHLRPTVLTEAELKALFQGRQLRDDESDVRSLVTSEILDESGAKTQTRPPNEEAEYDHCVHTDWPGDSGIGFDSELGIRLRNLNSRKV
jgi:hypothetical protein